MPSAHADIISRSNSSIGGLDIDCIQHTLAYNLGNLLRRLALPRPVKHWSLTTLREKLIKIGAKVVAHSRYIIFQMAEVAVPKRLFRAILERIRRLRLPEMVPG